MKRLTAVLLSSAFGLVLAIVLLAGHPAAAFAGTPDATGAGDPIVAPAVAPIGGDHTTGVDQWILDPTPAATDAIVVSAPPSPAVAPAPVAATATAASPADAPAATSAAPAAPAPPRSNMIGPATTAPPAAAPAADPAADPVDPTPVTQAPAPDVSVAVAYAVAQVGRPYRYAASGPNAFDCSGLTLAAYQQIGIDLPHRSESQVNSGRSVDWTSEAILPGDLIITAGGNGHHYAGHVGLAISSTEWVVAPFSGQVVHVEGLPFAGIESVRRLVEPTG